MKINNYRKLSEKSRNFQDKATSGTSAAARDATQKVEYKFLLIH